MSASAPRPHSLLRRVLWPCVGLLGVGALAGCEGDDTDDELPICIDVDVTTCTPQYSPEFDRVFSETLEPRCGLPGGACHGQPDADGAVRGLHISGADATHALLLDEGYVVPGDPSCSPLLVRLNTEDPAFLMPPGQQPLDADVRCSIAQWIADGAPR